MEIEQEIQRNYLLSDIDVAAIQEALLNVARNTRGDDDDWSEKCRDLALSLSHQQILNLQ